MTSTASARRSRASPTHSGNLVARVAPNAALTGVILTAGNTEGQVIAVRNEAAGANSITFAADATSNVQGGTGVVIAGGTQRGFIWSGANARWWAL